MPDLRESFNQSQARCGVLRVITTTVRPAITTLGAPTAPATLLFGGVEEHVAGRALAIVHYFFFPATAARRPRVAQV